MLFSVYIQFVEMFENIFLTARDAEGSKMQGFKMFLKVVLIVALASFPVQRSQPARVTEVSICLSLPAITLFAQSPCTNFGPATKKGYWCQQFWYSAKIFVKLNGFFCVFSSGDGSKYLSAPIVKISLKKGELFCLPYFYDHPRRNY